MLEWLKFWKKKPVDPCQAARPMVVRFTDPVVDTADLYRQYILERAFNDGGMLIGNTDADGNLVISGEGGVPEVVTPEAARKYLAETPLQFE